VDGNAAPIAGAWATTLDPADLPSLAASLAVPTTTSDTPAAALFPELDQLEAYAGRHPGAPLAEILERAAGEARLDGRYFFAQQTSVLEAAALLEAVPGLSLRDRFLFCAAPASPRDKRSGGALVAFAAAYASGGPVLLGGGGHAALLPVPDAAGATPPISTAGGMKDAEDAHAIVSLYMWLAHRFSGAAGRDRAPVRTRSQGLIP
jgi:ATP-dependent RNA helicase SUPV3L1/SUV3